jgi:hypothetical protein
MSWDATFGRSLVGRGRLAGAALLTFVAVRNSCAVFSAPELGLGLAVCVFVLSGPNHERESRRRGTVPNSDDCSGVARECSVGQIGEVQQLPCAEDSQCCCSATDLVVGSRLELLSLLIRLCRLWYCAAPVAVSARG